MIPDSLCPLVAGRAVVDGPLLQPVKLVDPPTDRHVTKRINTFYITTLYSITTIWLRNI